MRFGFPVLFRIFVANWLLDLLSPTVRGTYTRSDDRPLLSGCTRSIRLGHGVTLTPHRYNHPIRISGWVAALDVPSPIREASW
jgi:hypothetical protein